MQDSAIDRTKYFSVAVLEEIFGNLLINRGL